MNTMQEGIITLLKSAITQEALELPEGFDLRAAYPLVQKHYMFTLIYDGAVRCGIDRKSEVMGKLFQDYFRALRVSERQMAQVERIFRTFDENGIDYMPLKGCKMKALYPKPELRLMGDADILIRMDQYEQIKPMMRELGMTADHESDHELVWKNDSLYLELHKRVIPSYNKDFYAQMGDGWHLAKVRQGTRYSMTAEDEFFYLFTHFSKHYRDGGIGCRHVVDLWVFLRSHPELDEAQVKQELEKLQLLEFYENIRRLITVWFDDGVSDEKSDFITDVIFANGSWGTAENRVLGISVRTAKYRAIGTTKSKTVYVLRRMFPTVDEVKGQYPILCHKPWLLPVIWIVRLFTKLFIDKGTVARQRKLVAALKPENIESRQQALNYVGLDYHF